MVKPLSIDLRERAMARLDAGETVRDVGEALSVAPSTVVKWSLRRRATGSVAPARIGGHVPRKIQGEHEAWLRARMAAGPFTLREPLPRSAGLITLFPHETRPCPPFGPATAG